MQLFMADENFEVRNHRPHVANDNIGSLTGFLTLLVNYRFDGLNYIVVPSQPPPRRDRRKQCRSLGGGEHKAMLLGKLNEQVDITP
jgi:hypothetical protein